MANKKQYRIYCQTCVGQKSGWTNLDDPPDQCPVNPAHTVTPSSKCIETVLAIDNLTATTDPTSGDDIDDGYAAGSRWINTSTANEWSCADNAAGAAIWIKTRKDVFGTALFTGSSNSISSSNSTDWQNKLVLDLGTVSAGVYMVGFNYEITCSKGNYDAFGRVILDDATALQESVLMPWNNSTGIVPVGGVLLVTLTAASHHIDIEFKSSSSQNTVGIQKANLSVWRAS